MLCSLAQKGVEGTVPKVMVWIAAAGDFQHLCFKRVRGTLTLSLTGG